MDDISKIGGIMEDDGLLTEDDILHTAVMLYHDDHDSSHDFIGSIPKFGFGSFQLPRIPNVQWGEPNNKLPILEGRYNHLLFVDD